MDLLFELLQIAIGKKTELSRIPDASEWYGIYNAALKQAVAGILFTGVERLPEQQRPPKELVVKWYAVVRNVENRNRRMNVATAKVAQHFLKDGFRNVILKGQGIATFYPQPLRRQSGDIDIWLEGTRDKILDYVRGIFPDTKALYHHVDFPAMKDVAIEVHFIPSFCFNPFTDRCLQFFFKEKALFDNYISLPDNAGCIAIPTEGLNRIFLLRHTLGHFLDDGIGLRQIMDYYYLLEKSEHPQADENEKQLLKKLGMYKFAGALMYVLNKIFLLPEKKMLVPMNVKEGVFLIKEMMQTGNFGHNDERCIANRAPKSHLWRFLLRQRYYMRMLKHYPGEVVWMTFFDIKRYLMSKKR